MAAKDSSKYETHHEWDTAPRHIKASKGDRLMEWPYNRGSTVLYTLHAQTQHQRDDDINVVTHWLVYVFPSRSSSVPDNSFHTNKKLIRPVRKPLFVADHDHDDVLPPSLSNHPSLPIIMADPGFFRQ